MKSNGTIPNRKVTFRDTIPGFEVFKNLKFQATISNEIQNFNINDPNGFDILIKY